MRSGLTIPELYRRCAGVLLGLLLGAYIVFNKPFALLGWPPLYIGEIVLAVALPAVLFTFKTDILDQVRHNWGLSLLAAFFAYGAGRVIYDFPTYGMWAPRDGVLAGYALLAVLAPALWRPPPLVEGVPNPRRIALAQRVWLALIPISVLAVYWALAVSPAKGWIKLDAPPWKDTKPDFVTLATAVAAWIFFVSALRFNPLKPGSSRVLRVALMLVFGAAAAYAAALMLNLPTRAVWVSAVPLAGLCFILLPTTRATQTTFAVIAAIAVLAGGIYVLPKVSAQATTLGEKYEVGKNLDWSIADLERRLREKPETYPEFSVDLDLANLDPVAKRERIGSLLNPDEESFKTVAGRRGAHANTWRLVFWQRAINYTRYHAPWTGIGFGPNVTNVNRESPAWPMYIPAMSLGSRSPHSAHLSVFVRLGYIGLALWIGILVATILSVVGALWRFRTNADDAAGSEEFRTLHRGRFFDLFALFGVWLIYLCTMSFSVTIENPMGGMPFWALTGVLLIASGRERSGLSEL